MGKFQIGNKFSKGKPLGSKSKRTLEALEILEQQKFNPIKALIECHRLAKERFDIDVDKEDTGQISKMESNASKYLKIATDSAADIAGYAYPKLKSIEQKKVSATEGMTDQQKLDAARAVVLLLEQRVKDEPIPV